MLVRYTIIAPAEPSPRPIHFLPSGLRNWCTAGYQPPYFLPRYSARSVTSSSFSGYRLASSLVPRMMSGPAPVLAATAAFGRTSSQLSLSTRTSMPVLAVNAATLFMYWSMSPCTKRLQRSTRSLAPFSGALFHCAWASFTQTIGAAAPAATPAVVFRNSLRFILLMPSSCRRSNVLGEPCSARGIEKERQLRCKADALARVELVALAHDGGDIHA